MRACLGIIAALLAASAAAQTLTGTASVIDGDTLEIHGERIRLHGIDAPESAQSCYRDGQAWRCGQQASMALADRIGRKPVRCEGRERGVYGRLVAVCYQGNLDLNAWLVRQGWAMAYRRYSRDYVSHEQAAESAERGIWQGEFIAPWDWRRGERAGKPSVTRDRDCGDFDSWEEAQAFYERHQPGDPHRLDGNGDGEACEGLR